MIILVALSLTFTQMNFNVHSNWNAIYLNAIQIPDVGHVTKIWDGLSIPNLYLIVNFEIILYLTHINTK